MLLFTDMLRKRKPLNQGCYHYRSPENHRSKKLTKDESWWRKSQGVKVVQIILESLSLDEDKLWLHFLVTQPISLSLNEPLLVRLKALMTNRVLNNVLLKWSNTVPLTTNSTYRVLRKSEFTSVNPALGPLSQSGEKNIVKRLLRKKRKSMYFFCCCRSIK